jgi:hypothetical protein
MVEIEPVERLDGAVCLGRIVQLGKGDAIGPRVRGRGEFGDAPGQRAKQHAFAYALRRAATNEQGAVARSNGHGDRHAGPGEMRHEIRLGPDIGGPAGAVMRKAEHVTLAGRCHDQIDVVEAAIEHPALERNGKRKMFADKTRNRLCARRRVDRLEINHNQRPRTRRRDIILLL